MICAQVIANPINVKKLLQKVTNKDKTIAIVNRFELFGIKTWLFDDVDVDINDVTWKQVRKI